jgi:hypothetical protein
LGTIGIMPFAARLLLFTALLPVCSVAQFTVHVGDEPAVTLSQSDLAKLPRQSVKVTEHGVDANYEGVLVRDVLARPGVPLGKDLRGKALSTYVLATGRDGYAVVFSLTEFDPAFQDSDILLADKRDGKPLDEKQGPLRIIVPHDKKPARSVRMLERIDIVQLRK